MEDPIIEGVKAAGVGATRAAAGAGTYAVIGGVGVVAAGTGVGITLGPFIAVGAGMGLRGLSSNGAESSAKLSSFVDSGHRFHKPSIAREMNTMACINVAR